MDKKNSLLIVDDDASSLMELASILKREYKIFAVKDGKPAIEKAHEALPDLILLDVVMPEMNGFDVLAELKKSEKTRNIPVIFITGINDTEGESEGLSLGAVDYIRKPYDAMVVLHRVRIQIQIVNLQRDLENAADEARAANQSKSSFVANMSHEIRTPMNAIMGITDILIHNEDRSSVEVAEGLQKIYASSEMLLSLINDILDFSKIEAGKLDILPAQYRVASMINDTINLNIMRIEDKPIKFELNIDENMLAMLFGDELRIKQVLNNLLSNAFKYTAEGSVTLSVAYEDDPSGENVNLILSVKDTGTGMTQEQLDTLFDEYSRFNEDKNRNIEGTGLGLSIMRFLVSLMNGTVHVESEPGKGTAITIHMPQGAVGTDTLGKETVDDLRSLKQSNKSVKESGRIKRELMPYGKVLVVDDTETNLFVAVRFMEPYKLRIDTAGSGFEAIDIINSGNVYDIIFMDHMMPEMDGIEVTKRLRDSGYDQPIVALTANAMSGQAEMFRENGFDEFVSKPIDIHQLDSILIKFIRDRKPQEVIDAELKKFNDELINSKLQNSEELNGEQLNNEGKENKQESQPKLDAMLIESFKQDTYKALDTLNELYDMSGWYDNESHLQKYITNVHNLKGTLVCINEHALSDFAHKLEMGGRSKDTRLIEAETPGFLDKLRVLLNSLEQNSRDSASGNDDLKKLYEIMHELGELCNDYNRKGAFEVIAGMQNCTRETYDILSKIEDFILHSDFEEAAHTAVEYAAVLLNKMEQEKRGAAPQKSNLRNREIYGLDIIKGLQRFEDNEASYLKALRAYSAGTRLTLTEIGIVDEESLKDYKIKVHGIKGASYDVCAFKLGKMADDLENAADAGVIGFITDHNQEFIDSANKLIDDIDVLVATIEAENPKQKKDKPDDDLLGKLAVACDNYSMDDVDAIMTEIEKYEYDSDGGLVGILRKCVDLMQFRQIVKMLTDD